MTQPTVDRATTAAGPGVTNLSAALPQVPELSRLIMQGIDQRSKIVATLGPASDAPEMVARLIENGARVFRLNFSHGTHAEHGKRVETIRAVSEKLKVPVAILQDLSGPKMRIGTIAAPEMTLQGGTELLFTEEGTQGIQGSSLPVIPIPDLPLHTVKPGDRVFLADGRVVLTVRENFGSTLRAEVVATGVIRSRSGIAFPDSDLDLPATTDKDIADLRFGLTLSVNYVALSFVSGPADVQRVRDILNQEGSAVQIISKIERAKALERLEEILKVSDGIMVARGDLGIDIPLEDVPLAQDILIRRGRESQIPVIVATQMLETMMNEPRPSRAENSDVYLAGRLATDAVMLSGETAIGKYPAETVDMMRRSVNNGTIAFQGLLRRINEQHHGNSDLVPGDTGFGRWVATAALDPSIVGIVVCTTTGKSARLVSSHRPKPPIFAITTSAFTAEAVNLLWGVTPIRVPAVANSTEEVRMAVEAVRPYLEARIPQNSTHPPAVLVVSGRTPGVPGSTSQMQKVELTFTRPNNPR
jgi:pyruvate kinase